ncbi:Bgt-20029, partial [Blumeria graminis f. sp. tritici]
FQSQHCVCASSSNASYLFIRSFSSAVCSTPPLSNDQAQLRSLVLSIFDSFTTLETEHVPSILTYPYLHTSRSPLHAFQSSSSSSYPTTILPLPVCDKFSARLNLCNS